MKIKDNNKKECWKEIQGKNQELTKYIENKPLKQQKGSKVDKTE